MRISQKDVIDHGKLLLTDTFGVAMACRDLEHAKAVKRQSRKGNSRRYAACGEQMKRLCWQMPFFIIPVLIHGMDYDDTHVGSIIHQCSGSQYSIYSGEMVGATGKQMLGGHCSRLGDHRPAGTGVGGRFHDVGYRGTRYCFSFASQPGPLKPWGDTKETLVNALGICGSQSAAIQEFLHDGTWTKRSTRMGSPRAIYAF